jgi:hypothetical protein
MTQTEVQAFRSNAVINTYGVISDWMTMRLHRGADTWWGIPFGIGPDLDQVRTAPIARRAESLRRLLGRRGT